MLSWFLPWTNFNSPSPFKLLKVPINHRKLKFSFISLEVIHIQLFTIISNTSLDNKVQILDKKIYQIRKLLKLQDNSSLDMPIQRPLQPSLLQPNPPFMRARDFPTTPPNNYIRPKFIICRRSNLYFMGKITCRRDWG